MTLAGLRVLDVGDRPSTAWCSRLLADYGAEVLVVEGDEGHTLRQHPPFAEDGSSVAARYFLANKGSARASDQERLLAEADVIVTDDIDAARLHQRFPNAIVCAITPHGLTGQHRHRPGNDLTAYASSSWAHVNGIAGKPPLKGSGYQASYQAGTLGFGSIVCALLEADGGKVELIDISEREVLVSTSAPAPLRYQYSGNVWERRKTVTMNDGPVPVQDGHFALPLSRPAFWEKAMNLLGLPDLAVDPELREPGIRVKHADRFASRVQEAMAKWSRAELFDALGRLRVIAGPVLRMDELAQNPQFVERGFFRRLEHSDGDGAERAVGTRYPGPFARMSATGWAIKREMPAAGGCSGFSAGNGSFDSGKRRHPAKDKARRGPLSGYTGLVLTQAWAGTYATQMLALLGADVIQLETRSRLDSWRGTYRNPIPRALQERPEAKHAWNCNPLYNSVNLNKRCITVDLTRDEGIDIFRSLLPQMDFVAENFSPRVMGNFGLDYPALRDIKPDIIIASLSAYGATGPWAGVPGIGGTIEPSSGMSALLGYPGGPPLNSGQMYPDPVAGICGFSAIALALLHRERTGQGQYIDLSMQEANFTFIGDAWLEYELTGNVRGPLGNRHPLHAPHGVYPARPSADGSEQWIAIATESDAQFEALADALELADLSEWATAKARKSCEEELDQHITSRTAQHDKQELEAELLKRGVAAAAVLDPAEIVEDEALKERGHMVPVEHPEAGPAWQSGLPVKLTNAPGGVTRHAPLQGQHSWEVFHDLLGMTRSRYEELCELGVTGKGPTD